MRSSPARRAARPSTTRSANTPLEAANADPSTQTGKGSVPPTGTLLQDLLGKSDPNVSKQREQNMEALRRRAERGSPSSDPAEPALDYLLGGESQ